MEKNELYLSVKVFITKVQIEDTIFYVSNWRQDRHFTWSSKPHEALAACSATGVPPFRKIEPATSRSAVKRSTD